MCTISYVSLLEYDLIQAQKGIMITLVDLPNSGVPFKERLTTEYYYGWSTSMLLVNN